MKTNGKPLRFAALIRVSTEKQERKGESLRTQTGQVEVAVESLSGKIVTRYAGQEHATAGWERQQLDKLLADAAKSRRPFDAVIVADPSRWSRDNVASETGLTTLRDAGIRFYVLTTEYDLFDPQARLFLALSSSIGAYHASTQKQKSLLNRIARAKRGIPTGGKIPFGRAFNKETGNWSVDDAKAAMIRDVAERYLAGDPLPKLAKKHGVNHSNLCKLLRERCGEEWSIDFRADDLNIRETVAIRIPRLLPEATIRAVRARLEANRTYLHGAPKHHYLLAGRVFCAECGYALFGQVNPNGRRYYRHARRQDRVRDCSIRPRPWVRADLIEGVVVRDLFQTFANPAALERAMKSAVPDSDKLLKQRERIEGELSKLDRARGRVLNLIEKDAITDAQAEAKLNDIKGREAELRSELDRLAVALADVPDAESVRYFIERIGQDIVLLDEAGNPCAGGNDLGSYLAMDAADRRELVRVAFDGVLADGRPAGVYLTPAGGEPHGPKRYSYILRGRMLPPGSPRRVTPRASY